jgi:hypothetical protein
LAFFDFFFFFFLELVRVRCIFSPYCNAGTTGYLIKFAKWR